MDVNVLGQGGQVIYNTISDTSIKVKDDLLIEQNNSTELSSDVSIDIEQKMKKREKEIKKAIDKLNKFLEEEGTHIEYEKHKTFKHEFIIKIINNKTKEVIKEIPPKKILDMVAYMCKLAGVIVNKKV